MSYSPWKEITGAACVAAALILPAVAEEGKAVRAPAFTVKTLKAENYSLEQNLGKGPIVINFWATWCAPCILEMKNMKKAYKKYAPKGLQVLSIAIDDGKTESQIPIVVRSYKFPYTVLLDGNKDVFKAFHVLNVPQLFIVDREGSIVYSHQGYQKGDEKKVEEIVAGLLVEKKESSSAKPSEKETVQ